MHSRRLPVWMLFIAILTLPGCGLILDFDPTATPAEPRPFLCEAEIFRYAGTEFTESWQGWVFAADEFAGEALCRVKLEEYVTRSLAPGFVWLTRGFRITEGGPLHADPLLRKEPASECPADATGPPFTAGGPRGADLVMANPSPADARLLIVSALGGDPVSADPPLKLLTLRLAERHGFPGRLPPFDYQRLERHVRVSDFFLEVDTPFPLGAAQVDKLYIQAVGTIYATPSIFRPDEWFFENRPTAKFYFFGRARLDSDSALTSFCFPARATFFHASQGPTSPGFAFQLALTSADLDGLPLSILFNFGALSSDPPVLVSGEPYQPFVRLSTHETPAFAIDLGGAEGDVFHDNDTDLARILWFEDFETESERFLGQGLPLSVRFSPGDREITAVAYDTRGAYNFDTATIRVLEPVAADDAFTTDEDTPLVVPSPGVLANDTDAGVPRIAQLVSGPSHGALVFSPDGSFLYTPDANFFGSDLFRYRVDHDGLALTSIAEAAITVVELSPQEEADRLADMCTELQTRGLLTAGQATSCRATLDGASADLDRGSVGSACNKLAAFINHLTSLVRAGTLTAEDAQPLLDRANNLQAELGC